MLQCESPQASGSSLDHDMKSTGRERERARERERERLRERKKRSDVVKKGETRAEKEYEGEKKRDEGAKDRRGDDDDDATGSLDKRGRGNSPKSVACAALGSQDPNSRGCGWLKVFYRSSRA